METDHVRPVAALNAAAGADESLFELKFRKNELLVRKLASGLGFSLPEYREVRNEIWLKAKAGPACGADPLTFRIRLLRAAVHQCVFRIHASLFSRSNSPNDGSREPTMPLSAHIAYILYTELGLNEREIAAVMNVGQLQIRERLKKAILLQSRNSA